MGKEDYISSTNYAMEANQKTTPMQVTFRIREDWINAFLDRQALAIPLRDSYTLSRLSVGLSTAGIRLTGDIGPVTGARLEASAGIRWDVPAQRLYIEDLEVKTHTRNLKVKSAGWFAATFLLTKITRRAETAVHELIQAYLLKLSAEAVVFPIPGQGTASALLRQVVIDDLWLAEKKLTVTATLTGSWAVDLSVSEEVGDITNAG